MARGFVDRNRVCRDGLTAYGIVAAGRDGYSDRIIVDVIGAQDNAVLPPVGVDVVDAEGDVFDGVRVARARLGVKRQGAGADVGTTVAVDFKAGHAVERFAVADIHWLIGAGRCRLKRAIVVLAERNIHRPSGLGEAARQVGVVAPSAVVGPAQVLCVRCEGRAGAFAVDGVVAQSTNDRVIANAAFDRVVIRAAINPVVASATKDLVVAVAAKDAVSARATVNRISTSARIDGVIPIFAINDVSASTSLDRVIARAAIDDVVAVVRDNCVVAAVGVDRVVARARCRCGGVRVVDQV